MGKSAPRRSKDGQLGRVGLGETGSRSGMDKAANLQAGP